ncbi:MAG: hypothetical protein LAT68_10830 [Cyclobacteriaceae bacterium]|nr:hypothetical protein [Cyclobacteriaceae bacterium]MCH8516809.1 hypothetical protein [Cyclobacteriaceae bacterium]
MAKIFYITGLHGELLSGFGQYLRDQKLNFEGVQLDEEFHERTWKDRKLLIRKRVSTFYEDGGRYLVAVSYGAYLFLHLLRTQSFPKLKVLLLSPLLGARDADSPLSEPPEADELAEAIATMSLKQVAQIHLLYGIEDPIVSSTVRKSLQKSYASMINFQAVDGCGHELPHDVVSEEFQKFYCQLDI